MLTVMMAVMAVTGMPAAQDADEAMAAYRAATSVEPRCAATEDPQQITVCGRRQADRYRVSFVTTDPRDSVPVEREMLLRPPMGNCGRVGAFFVDCGHVGVTLTAGGSGIRLKTRRLAP